MKRLYWRPQRISSRILLLIALSALIGFVLVETLQVKRREPYYREKIQASKLAKYAFETLRQARLAKDIIIDRESDPADTGLIGLLASPCTTNAGHLPAKQTSIDPNFAALMVHYFKKLGLEEGDVVGVGMSGSFPAINVAVIAAMETLRLKPIIIASAGSSQWGANVPEFLWPDMETCLYKNNVISCRSAAVSLGGIEDCALGLTEEGKEMLKESILKNGLYFLDVKNYQDGVVKKMELYRKLAGDKEIKAYVNVGGGTTSVGTRIGKRMFHPGINRRPPLGGEIDSIMLRFVMEGVPIIHLTKIEELAQRYGFPIQPAVTPSVGEGKIYFNKVKSKTLASSVLLLIVLMLYVLVRLDWGFRLFGNVKLKSSNNRPEEMI